MSATEERFNKSAFIRQYPNLKPAEIIAEAAKVGQEISPGAIWTLRSSDKRKAAGEGNAKKGAKVAKKAVKKIVKTEGKFNKSAFIRRFPNWKPARIIEKAATLGQTITAPMIYSLRSADKKAGQGKVETQPTLAAKKIASTKTEPVSLMGRPSIAFDPSDPVARRFISRALARDNG